MFTQLMQFSKRYSRGLIFAGALVLSTLLLLIGFSYNRAQMSSSDLTYYLRDRHGRFLGEAGAPPLIPQAGRAAVLRQAEPEKDSYWIWAGVAVPAYSRGKNLYMYQGAFRRNRHGIEYARKGLYPHRLHANEVHLVFRLESLDSSESFKNTILMLISHWEQKKTTIRGIQLDFDSPTGKLDRYSVFLKEVRNWLPSRYRLTITGLGDWLLLGQPKLLQALLACVDEIVFQLYSGRQYVPGLERYIAELQRLDIPFKVGLLSNRSQNKTIENAIRRNPHYRGSICFIQAT
jgi:hypothetical protein